MVNTIFLSLFLSVLPAPTSNHVAASCLSVHLALDKAQYKLNETFSFQVSLENCGTADLYVERYANLAGGGNFILDIRQSETGRKVYPQFGNISDAVPPFDDEGRLPVVLLPPGGSFVNMKELKVREYFRKPGRYTVTVSYASVLPESATSARPVWDLSHPVIASNTVVITVGQAVAGAAKGPVPQSQSEPIRFTGVRQRPR
jgi:hypothetical protein